MHFLEKEAHGRAPVDGRRTLFQHIFAHLIVIVLFLVCRGRRGLHFPLLRPSGSRTCPTRGPQRSLREPKCPHLYNKNDDFARPPFRNNGAPKFPSGHPCPPKALPRLPQGSPRDHQERPKGTPKSPRGSTQGPPGDPRPTEDPQGDQGSPQTPLGSPRAQPISPKGPQGSPQEPPRPSKATPKGPQGHLKGTRRIPKGTSNHRIAGRHRLVGRRVLQDGPTKVSAGQGGGGKGRGSNKFHGKGKTTTTTAQRPHNTARRNARERLNNKKAPGGSSSRLGPGAFPIIRMIS